MLKSILHVDIRLIKFLSPLHNLRKDEWGGAPGKRRKFLMEVYKEIRK